MHKLPALLLALAACTSSTAPQPEFELLDVNPTSLTGNMLVSPSDHIGRVSAWYFGSAT